MALAPRCSVVLADALDNLQGARRGLERGNASLAGVALVAIGVLALVAAVCAAVWFVRRRARYQANWSRFANQVAELDLSRRLGTLLVEMARDQGFFNPTALVEKPDVFERTVQDYLRPFVAHGPDDPELHEACVRVRKLRQALGFTHSRGVTPNSTRQLEPGLRIRLSLPGGRAAAEVWAETAAVREDYLELKNLGAAGQRLTGRTVQAVFFSSKHAFSFRTEVVRVDRSRARALLLHTVDLKSAGNREFHRVEVESPITFRAVWESPEVQRDGVLLDLSAGGAALRCPCFYEHGERITLDLQPEDYYSPYEALEELEPRQLTATILSVQRTADDECTYHMEFREISGDDRHYVSQLVHRIDVSERGAAW